MTTLHTFYLDYIATTDPDDLDAVKSVWRNALIIELRERALSGCPTYLVDQRYKPAWKSANVTDLIALAGDLDVLIERVEKTLVVKPMKTRNAERIAAWRAARAAGQTLAQIAETYGVTKQNISLTLKRADLNDQ